MNEIKKAQKALQRISAALEFCEYKDSAPIWAFVEDVAEVVNGIAPDLLEALEYLEAVCACKTLPYENHPSMIDARAAIAKAKGGAQ